MRSNVILLRNRLQNQMVQRAIWLREYFWACGFVSIALVFSPLLLVVKIFLLMGLTCLAVFLALLAAFRRQPLPVAGT